MAVLSSPVSDSHNALHFSLNVDLLECTSNRESADDDFLLDDMSIMQIHGCTKIQYKNAPPDLQHGDLTQVFHGQQFPDDAASESDVQDALSSEGHRPVIARFLLQSVLRLLKMADKTSFCFI